MWATEATLVDQRTHLELDIMFNQNVHKYFDSNSNFYLHENVEKISEALGIKDTRAHLVHHRIQEALADHGVEWGSVPACTMACGSL